ncbi:hypothetical protein IIA15_06510 [candidate division TA06 bacterium]|nr:hypothetical protein [candidate division TA06 bacterium]
MKDREKEEIRERKVFFNIEKDSQKEWGWVQPCPNCGQEMVAVAGRKDAICPRCGYKESCCY